MVLCYIFSTDECFRSAVMIPQWIKDNSNEYSAPFNMAIDKYRSLFEWLSLTENLPRFRRMTEAMTGGSERFPPTIFTGGESL